MDQDELQEVLRAHAAWLRGDDDGVCATLRDATLRGADLRGADLRCADLWGADLRYASLRYATLRGADLRCATLRCADLRCADLWDADLSHCVGNMREIKSMQVAHHSVVWTVDRMWIGCKCKTHAEWWSMTGADVDEMNENGAAWGQWKPLLRQIVEASA